MLNRIGQYLADHWAGNHSLARSFWINFIALRLGIFIAQANLLPEKGTDYSSNFMLILLLIFVFHIVIFIWQAVGLLRSAERYAKDYGSQAHAWATQIALVVAVFLIFSSGLEAWQTTIPVSTEENHLIVMDREHASKYKLAIDGKTKMLTIDGSIELGITRNLKNLLLMNPQVKDVRINSIGGNIYEARGLAKIFTDNGFNTLVTDTCTSACTLAFVGGRRRAMEVGAKIGFHQYRIDSSVQTIRADPKAEQKRDQELFRSNGVSPAFNEKIYSAPSNQMWFPTPEEMLEANYVHEIR